jgi:hypothetical protein
MMSLVEGSLNHWVVVISHSVSVMTERSPIFTIERSSHFGIVLSKRDDKIISRFARV